LIIGTGEVSHRVEGIKEIEHDELDIIFSIATENIPALITSDALESR
jgi:hypothetical protein